MFCINAFVLVKDSAFVICSSVPFFSATSFRARASCKTLTSGPLPDKKTACSPLSILCLSFAILSPASVLPEPGTPVRKQIDFWLLFFENSMTSEIA